MRFRVVRLLRLMVCVAIFAAAIAMPSEKMASAVAFMSWLVYAILGWWAFAHPKNRFTICSALIFGVSYLGMGLFYSGENLLPTLISEGMLTWLLDENTFGYRVSILEFAWSFFFAMMGGLLGAYWSRSQMKK